MIVLLILGLVIQQHPVMSQLAMFASGMNALNTFNDLHDTYLKFTTPSTADVLDKTIELAVQLDSLEETLGTMQESIENLLVRLPLLGKITDDVRLLNSLIARIEALYEELLYYLENPEYFTDDSHDDLFKTFTSYRGGDVAGILTQINALIIPRKLGHHKESLFLLLAQEIQDEDLEGCGTGGALQGRLYELFDVISDAEMKASIMMGFGYMMQTYVHNKNTSGLLRKAEQQLGKRSGQYFDVLKESLVFVPSFFRRCDPAGGHERGVTFHEFERFLTAIIVQEGPTNERNLCDKTCDQWPMPAVQTTQWNCRGFGCAGGDFRCGGRLASCTDQPSTTLCQYKPLQSRRYEWFETHDQLYGYGRTNCTEGEMHTPAPISFSSHACDLCRCICSEDDQWSASSRFISLREQLSNVEDNMVVIGLQFVMMNRIAHVKIMQGKVGPGAAIFRNSTSWIEPENIRFNPSNYGFIKTSEDGTEQTLKVDTDVADFVWERRRIYLDTLNLPKNQFLTGIRFRRDWGQQSAPVLFEIQGTRFDLETFKLETDSSTWVAPDVNRKREQYEGGAFDNPIRSTSTSLDSTPYSFIDLEWSSIENDGGQTTIPLLDGLPVYADRPVPMIGVGLHHKKQPGYGGFLTFVLEGFNRAAYLTQED